MSDMGDIGDDLGTIIEILLRIETAMGLSIPSSALKWHPLYSQKFQWHVGRDADGRAVQRHLVGDCNPACPIHLGQRHD